MVIKWSFVVIKLSLIVIGLTNNALSANDSEANISKAIMYSIIDIETTGLSPKKGKITEIAVFVHDGEKIVDELSTLINPETEIPYRITQMTGINNKMVKDAPKFYEVAKKIVEMTEGTTIVAHNVNFDYNFIRHEFKELGYDFKREKMCTVRLSRKLLPGRRSYSLGKLCEELNIKNPHRHRAKGDATATVQLFELLLKAEKNLKELSLRGLNTNLDRKDIDNLPKKTGVYYFHNDKGDIIYIGKSLNIHDRVMSHLTNYNTKRALEMRNQTAAISYELTGSELVALLLESDEIKKHKPKFNRAQRRSAFPWGLYKYTDDKGYLRLKIAKNENGDIPLTTFSSQQTAKNNLFMLSEAFGLCQKLCGLFDTKGPCFQYQVHQCNGACIGKEPPELYNARVKQAVEPFGYHRQSFIIVDKGRNDDEKSIVAVENGKYLGFGFLDTQNEMIESSENLKSVINAYSDNRDVQQIIRSYLKKKKAERVIEINE